MKFELYEQVARVGKAIGHGTRLEIIELLAQAEQSVEDLASTTGAGVTSTSSHLQVLKRSGLVRTRREGTRIFYRLSSPEVAGLFVAMKSVAAQLLPAADSGGFDGAHPGVPLVTSLDDTADAFILDVRPRREFDSGHFPDAVSIPIDELEDRRNELPDGRRVVIYCRGEFCELAREAAQLLRDHGVDAYAMTTGVLEWRAGADVDLGAGI